MKKKIYLANGYGFSRLSRELIIPKLVEKLEGLGLDVVEPFERNSNIDLKSYGWPYEVGQRCLQDVKDCDGIFAIVNGTPPDEGVMVELGYAMALGKKIFLFRDDFRRCADSGKYPLNLMVFAGLSEANWWRSYFEHIDELTHRDKDLISWTTEKSNNDILV